MTNLLDKQKQGMEKKSQTQSQHEYTNINLHQIFPFGYTSPISLDTNQRENDFQFSKFLKTSVQQMQPKKPINKSKIPDLAQKQFNRILKIQQQQFLEKKTITQIRKNSKDIRSIRNQTSAAISSEVTLKKNNDNTSTNMSIMNNQNSPKTIQLVGDYIPNQIGLNEKGGDKKIRIISKDYYNNSALVSSQFDQTFAGLQLDMQNTLFGPDDLQHFQKSTINDISSLSYERRIKPMGEEINRPESQEMIQKMAFEIKINNTDNSDREINVKGERKSKTAEGGKRPKQKNFGEKSSSLGLSSLLGIIAIDRAGLITRQDKRTAKISQFMEIAAKCAKGNSDKSLQGTRASSKAKHRSNHFDKPKNSDQMKVQSINYQPDKLTQILNISRKQKPNEEGWFVDANNLSNETDQRSFLSTKPNCSLIGDPFAKQSMTKTQQKSILSLNQNHGLLYQTGFQNQLMLVNLQNESNTVSLIQDLNFGQDQKKELPTEIVNGNITPFFIQQHQKENIIHINKATKLRTRNFSQHQTMRSGCLAQSTQNQFRIASQQEIVSQTNYEEERPVEFFRPNSLPIDPSYVVTRMKMNQKHKERVRGQENLKKELQRKLDIQQQNQVNYSKKQSIERRSSQDSNIQITYSNVRGKDLHTDIQPKDLSRQQTNFKCNTLGDESKGTQRANVVSELQNSSRIFSKKLHVTNSNLTVIPKCLEIEEPIEDLKGEVNIEPPSATIGMYYGPMFPENIKEMQLDNSQYEDGRNKEQQFILSNQSDKNLNLQNKRFSDRMQTLTLSPGFNEERNKLIQAFASNKAKLEHVPEIIVDFNKKKSIEKDKNQGRNNIIFVEGKSFVGLSKPKEEVKVDSDKVQKYFEQQSQVTEPEQFASQFQTQPLLATKTPTKQKSTGISKRGLNNVKNHDEIISLESIENPAVASLTIFEDNFNYQNKVHKQRKKRKSLLGHTSENKSLWLVNKNCQKRIMNFRSNSVFQLVNEKEQEKPDYKKQFDKQIAKQVSGAHPMWKQNIKVNPSYLLFSNKQKKNEVSFENLNCYQNKKNDDVAPKIIELPKDTQNTQNNQQDFEFLANIPRIEGQMRNFPNQNDLLDKHIRTYSLLAGESEKEIIAEESRNTNTQVQSPKTMKMEQFTTEIYSPQFQNESSPCFQKDKGTSHKYFSLSYNQLDDPSKINQYDTSTQKQSSQDKKKAFTKRNIQQLNVVKEKGGDDRPHQIILKNFVQDKLSNQTSNNLLNSDQSVSNQQLIYTEKLQSSYEKAPNSSNLITLNKEQNSQNLNQASYQSPNNSKLKNYQEEQDMSYSTVTAIPKGSRQISNEDTADAKDNSQEDSKLVLLVTKNQSSHIRKSNINTANLSQDVSFGKCDQQINTQSLNYFLKISQDPSQDQNSSVIQDLVEKIDFFDKIKQKTKQRNKKGLGLGNHYITNGFAVSTFQNAKKIIKGMGTQISTTRLRKLESMQSRLDSKSLANSPQFGNKDRQDFIAPSTLKKNDHHEDETFIQKISKSLLESWNISVPTLNQVQRESRNEMPLFLNQTQLIFDTQVTQTASNIHLSQQEDSMKSLKKQMRQPIHYNPPSYLKKEDFGMKFRRNSENYNLKKQHFQKIRRNSRQIPNSDRFPNSFTSQILPPQQFFDQQSKIKCNKGQKFVDKQVDNKFRIDGMNFMRSTFGDPDFKGNTDLVVIDEYSHEQKNLIESSFQDERKKLLCSKFENVDQNSERIERNHILIFNQKDSVGMKTFQQQPISKEQNKKSSDQTEKPNLQKSKFLTHTRLSSSTHMCSDNLQILNPKFQEQGDQFIQPNKLVNHLNKKFQRIQESGLKQPVFRSPTPQAGLKVENTKVYNFGLQGKSCQ